MTRAEAFRGKLIMAPMTRGTDLPFRRLAHECGAEIALGEMAYAHKVVRGDRAERALLRRHPSERLFGVQLAGKDPQVMAEAARIAVDQGADFVDVNLGCPIDDTTRRGFGAALLQHPARVGRIIAAMRSAVSTPLTVKLRLGWSSEKPTFLKVGRAAEEAGADAVTIHARSRSQRYRRAADWTRVGELVEALRVPVIGNGDILRASDARDRMRETGCAAVMVGRFGLVAPWIFREYAEGRDLEMDAEARLAIVRRYAELCLEHFGDDERGRATSRRFLTFHQDFFRRYRRGARPVAATSDDPRDWGEAPCGELEDWLCRGDQPASEALCRWLVDGHPPEPPPALEPGAERAVMLEAHG